MSQAQDVPIDSTTTVSSLESCTTAEKPTETTGEQKQMTIFRPMTKAHVMVTLGMLLVNVSPLIVLIVMGKWDYRLALGISALWAIVLLFINYALWYFGYCLIKVHTMHIAMVLALGLLFILTFVVPTHFYQSWFHVIFHCMVFLYAVGGFIINKPFTMDFAKAAYHEDVWHLPIIRRDMRIACIPWMFSFAVNSAISTVKEIFGHRWKGRYAVTILVFLVVPVLMISIAVIITVRIRRKLDKKLLDLVEEMRKTGENPMVTQSV